MLKKWEKILQKTRFFYKHFYSKKQRLRISINSEPKFYEYRTSIKWIGEKKGKLSSKGKPDLEIACPPEFGGHENIWSSEDIFLASIEACTMTTFVHFANITSIGLISYDSKAIGKVKIENNSYIFDSVNIQMKIKVKTDRDKKKVERMLKHIKKTCLISNSIKSKIDYKTEIIVG